MLSLETPSARRRRGKSEELSTVAAQEPATADLLTSETTPVTTSELGSNDAAKVDASPAEIADSIAPADTVAPDAQTATSAAGPSAEEKNRRSSADMAKARKLQQAKTAKAQRKRHKELLAEWMPTQTGAVIKVNVKIGHQAVGSWYKRFYLQVSAMLGKIHTFPRVKLTYEDIAKIEQTALDAITKSETKINALTTQLDLLIDQADVTMAEYLTYFTQDVYVSTRAAFRLYTLISKADAITIRLDTLYLHGLITPERYATGVNDTRKAIFSLCEKIKSLRDSLYTREGQEVPEGDEQATDAPSQISAMPSATDAANDGTAKTTASEESATQTVPAGQQQEAIAA